MLSPKRTKYRKAFKGRIHGLAKGGTALNFGAYGMKAVEPGRVTARQIEATIGAKSVRVWHTNDAKAPRGSKLDRHEQIGRGTIGLEAFRRLLNDRRFAHCAFVAEVPVEQPDDDRKNVALLKSLVIPAGSNRAIRRQSVK